MIMGSTRTPFPTPTAIAVGVFAFLLAELVLSKGASSNHYHWSLRDFE